MSTNIHMVKDKRKKTFDPEPVFKILKLIFLKKKLKYQCMYMKQQFHPLLLVQSNIIKKQNSYTFHYSYD